MPPDWEAFFMCRGKLLAKNWVDMRNRIGDCAFCIYA